MPNVNINEISKGAIVKGLATTAGYIIGGNLTAKALGKLDPYNSKKKKKKKVIIPAVSEVIISSDKIIKHIITTNPMVLSRKIGRLKNLPGIYKNLKSPKKKTRKGQDIKEKIGKLISKGIAAIKKSGPISKTVAKGAGIGAAWSGLDVASKVVNKKAVDKAALKQASRDVEHELRKKHGASLAKRIIRKSHKRLSRKRKTESRVGTAGKLGLIAAGSIASDLVAGSIADYYKNKKKKKNPKKVSENHIKYQIKDIAKKKAKSAGKIAFHGATVLTTAAIVKKLLKR